LNYGIVKYVKWKKHQTCKERLPNPIIYTYLKNNKYSDEKELRISLSAPGVMQFILLDGNMIKFPDSFQFLFDFKTAHSNSIIQRLLFAPDCNVDHLKTELSKHNIEAVEE
jgi:hypothetical protein